MMSWFSIDTCEDPGYDVLFFLKIYLFYKNHQQERGNLQKEWKVLNIYLFAMTFAFMALVTTIIINFFLHGQR